MPPLRLAGTTLYCKMYSIVASNLRLQCKYDASNSP